MSSLLSSDPQRLLPKTQGSQHPLFAWGLQEAVSSHPAFKPWQHVPCPAWGCSVLPWWRCLHPWEKTPAAPHPWELCCCQRQ